MRSYKFGSLILSCLLIIPTLVAADVRREKVMEFISGELLQVLQKVRPKLHKIESLERTCGSYITFDQFHNVYWMNFSARTEDNRIFSGQVRAHVPKNLETMTHAELTKSLVIQRFSAGGGVWLKLKDDRGRVVAREYDIGLVDGF